MKLATAAMTLVVTMGLSASQGWAQAQSPQGSTRWYVTNQTMNEIEATIELDERSQFIKLNQGWTCLVGSLTAQITHSFRETTCSNDGKEIAFTVQCAPDKRKDHVQIRFKDKNSRPVDFIEVGCELTK